MSDLLALDPWSDPPEWVDPMELRARCYRYAERASTVRYRAKRRWFGITKRMWLPDARWFVSHADMQLRFALSSHAPSAAESSGAKSA